jgi:hypothetical protein
MKTYFLCLANSKKYGERCIAGIEVKVSATYQITIVRDENGKPKWIRPVSESANGQVSELSVQRIKLYDIVEVDITKSLEAGYQSENKLFTKRSIKFLKKVTPYQKTLEALINHEQENLFGNTERSVSKADIAGISHSLTFIRVSKPQIYLKHEYDRRQWRMKFNFKHNEYDLPITDADFMFNYNINQSIFDDADEVYLTISLGIEHEGWHYKIVAGIIWRYENISRSSTANAPI